MYGSYKELPKDEVRPEPPQKATHINWGVGEHREKMVKAISDWLNKTPEGDRSDNNGERIDNICMYAFVVGILYKNLYRYITPNIDKIKELGDGAHGSAKLLTDGDVRFIG